MKKGKVLFKFLLLIYFTFNSFILFAQEDVVEMADTMRSNGKIYVVVTVLSVILSGIFIYLITIDRRLKKIEKQQNKE